MSLDLSYLFKDSFDYFQTLFKAQKHLRANNDAHL